MEEHVRLRREYVRLVRAEEHDAAQKILEIIQGRRSSEIEKPQKVETPIKTIIESPVLVKVEEPKYSSLSDLELINGIGKKTIKDIEVMFGDLESLKNALIIDKVALRDDIVKKLREELIK